MRRVRAALSFAAAVLLSSCGDDDSFLLPPFPTAPPAATATTTATPQPTPTPTPTSTPTPTLTPTSIPTLTPTSIPTVTATARPMGLPGPEITFFGLTRADDTLLSPVAVADDGTPIYARSAGALDLASGFVLVIEGRPGSNGLAVGRSSYDPTGASFPDLRVQVTQPLGNGSETVCDDPQSNPGGVPATVPVSFDATPANIAAANDLGCRFLDGTGEPRARTNSGDSCVNFNGRFDFVEEGTTTQFCGFVNVPLGFPSGDTVVTASLRDQNGNWGDFAQIIVRVAQ